ncbi:MAG: ATP-binding protein [Acidimicrobiales bacterium]
MSTFLLGSLSGIVIGAISLWILVIARRDRRAVAALDEAIQRLTGGSPTGEEERGLAARIAWLDRAVDEALAVLDEATDLQSTLERALDAIPQGVVVVDETASLVFQNEVAAGYAGARHADALVQAAVDELIAEAVRGEAGHRVLELFGPPRRTLVIDAIPLPSHRGIGALAVIEDVSERRRLESVRRDFVANISHELKTPVGALGLLAETMLAEDDPEIRQRLAERIHAEAFRVGRTIEDLLELSRIESGELPHRAPVAVHLVLAEAVERIRPAAEQAGIRIEVEEPTGRLAVLGDRRQLVSAIYNLLDNAVKYSDRGSAVEVWASTDGVHVEIAVRDRGIGIPAADLERVFERFYRVDHARSRQTGGTGLGLAIVRHVVNNHDGSVHVESRLGEGSTFTLRLPSASGPVVLAPPDVDGRVTAG